MQTEKTSTYAQHQFDNPCAACKKSAAETENTTEFLGTHKSEGHPLVFCIYR